MKGLAIENVRGRSCGQVWNTCSTWLTDAIRVRVFGFIYYNVYKTREAGHCIRSLRSFRSECTAENVTNNFSSDANFSWDKTVHVASAVRGAVV